MPEIKMNVFAPLAKRVLATIAGLALASSAGSQSPTFLYARAGFFLAFEDGSAIATQAHIDMMDQQIGRVLQECGKKWTKHAWIWIETGRASPNLTEPSPRLMYERVERLRAYAERFGTQRVWAGIHEWMKYEPPSSPMLTSSNLVRVRSTCVYRQSDRDAERETE